MVEPARTLRTADGTNTGAFGAGDWALALAVAAIWGSSFLWTAIGLDSLDPAAVAFPRIVLGAAALWAYPPTRRPVDRAASLGIAIVAVAGNAGPALLFAIAQQHVESSVAGMINAATPLAALVVTILLTGHTPGTRQAVGLLIGLLGVATMTAPNLASASAEPLGITLLFVAIAGYGISNNIMVPLQQTYGAPAIVGRALIIGSLLLAPLGMFGLSRSHLTPGSVAAVTILGVAGTGIARALNATLAGRTGAARGALTTYLVPVVAIALGVLFRNDHIEAIELAGTALVLAGAYLTSRRQRTTTADSAIAEPTGKTAPNRRSRDAQGRCRGAHTGCSRALPSRLRQLPLVGGAVAIEPSGSHRFRDQRCETNPSRNDSSLCQGGVSGRGGAARGCVGA